ncbi:MAG: leucine-rich repeat protein [Clostridia bacterium]|nr:leucine-rich repeat protein [Clostridia bacterium]
MAKKKIVFIAMLSVVLSLSLLGFASCKKKPTEQPQAQDYGEAGVYYVEVNGEEYTLMLNGGTYAVTLGEAYGEYEYDGSTLTLKGDKAISAKIEGDAVNLTYDGKTYRFLKKVSYEVTYNTDGGSAVTKATVLNGKTLDKPADPSKAGYDFVGWYADADYKTPFAFGSTPITANTTIYARYAEKTGLGTEFTVSFDTGNGVAVPAQNTVGGKLYNLPVLAGAGFAGWYVSDAQNGEKLTYKYEGQTLDSNVTLFAVFEDNVPQPSVDAGGVKWNSAGPNTEYSLKITGPDGGVLVNWNSGITNFAYDFTDKPAGEYEVTLTVKGNSSKAYYVNKGLARVSVFEVDSSILRYNAVPNAERYFINVECGNASHNHVAVNNGTSLYYNFDACEMKEGGIKFVVTAEADGYVSSVSEAYYVDRTLAPVTGVYVNDNDVVVWDKVEGASEYVVEITAGGEVSSVNVGANTGFSLKNYSGNLSVKVYAQKKGYNSSSSEATAYNKSTLASPVNVNVEGSTVTWNAVEGAFAYEVNVDNKVYTVQENAFDLGNVIGLTGAGPYALTVKAIAENAANNSQLSESVSVISEESNDVISYANGYVVWQYALGANYYEVKVNDETLVKVQNSNKYAVTLTKAGENTISVRHNYGENSYTDWVSLKVLAYAITFDVRGGAALSPMYKAVGDYMVLPTTQLLGYDFADWYTVPGGATVNGKVYNSTTYDVASDITLYAYYNPKDYVVTFDFNNGGTGEAEATVSYNDYYTLPVPESNDPSMGFAGWYTEAFGQGIRYTNELGESINPWRDVEEKTLFANWVNKFEFLPVNNGESYSVMGAAGMRNMSYVKVPASYNGKPVTVVEGAAFISANKLVTIEIPNTVQLIEVDTAFSNCNMLQEVIIYDAKAEYPDDDAVQNAETGNYTTIDGVVFQQGETGVLEIKFYPRGKVGKYELPEGTEVIPANVFSNAKLTEIVIPASVRQIQSNAFYYCSKLTKVTFKTIIGGTDVALEVLPRAFSSCETLETITFPKRLSSFDNTIFKNCKSLKAVNVDGTGGAYTSIDGVLCDADGTEILYVPVAFKPADADGVYTIPSGINKIGGGAVGTLDGDTKNGGAFAGCKNIKTVVIPGYVTEIGENAFRLSYVSEVIFEGNSGDAQLELGEGAFYSCSRLTSIVLPDYLNKIGANAFYSCSRLKTVTINSKGNVDFANGAFMGYNSNSYVETLNIGKDLGLIQINGIFGSRVVNVNIDEANTNYKVIDDVIYNNEYVEGEVVHPAVTELLYYPLGKTGNYEFPVTITTIGAYVFQYKENLTQITIPKTIVEIGEHAFEYCENLTSVTFEGDREEDLTIGDYAFAYLPAENIVLPEKTTEIGNGAFANSAIYTISVPSTVTKMGTYDESGNLTEMSVFEGCSNLYGLNIHADNEYFYTDAAGVLYLKANNGDAIELVYAVKGAVPAGVTASTEVTVPSTVTKVWPAVFKENNKITKITFSTTDPIVFDYVKNSNGTNTNYSDTFYGATALKEVTLSEGFTKIPGRTFYECYSIESIDIPYTVTEIGTQAFMNCVSLETVNFTGDRMNGDTVAYPLTIADGSTSTGGGTKYNNNRYGVFVGCIKLKNVTLPEGTTKIGQNAFAIGDLAMDEYFAKEGTDEPMDLGLEHIFIPSTLATNGLGNAAFLGIPVETARTANMSIATSNEIGDVISGLKTVTFADGCNVTTFGNAFNYAGLESIRIPAKVTALNSTFVGAKNLTTVTFEEGSVLNSISANSFASSGLTAISLPATLNSIGGTAFKYCRDLSSVTFEVNGDGNSALKDVTGRSPAPAIGNQAFAYTALGSIAFPKSNQATYSLGTYLFEGCENLTAVTLPVSVVNVDNVFAGNKSIQEIVLAEGHSAVIENTVLEEGSYALIYNNSTKTAINFALGKLPSTFEIPEGVTQIGVRAFDGHNELKNVIIPKEVTSIGNYAFNECENIESVIFEGAKAGGEDAARLNALNIYAFYGCKKLKSIVLPDSLTKVGAHAFEKCTSLSSVTLGNVVSSIMGYAFAETAITSITLPSTLVKLGSYGVGYTEGKTGTDYSLEDQGAFYGCTKLTSITFEGPLNFIGYYTFAGCTSLTQFTIPSTVTAIASHAFDGSGLTSITIPSGVILGSANTTGTGSAFTASTTKNVNVGIFANCLNLENVTFTGSVESLALPGHLFENCPSLTEINFVSGDQTITNSFPDYVNYIGDYLFAGTGFTSFEFKYNPTNLGGCLFSGAKDLTDVVLHREMTFVDGTRGGGYSVGRSRLTNTAYGNSYMFENCESLVNIGYYNEAGVLVNGELPDTVTEIPTGFFKGCKSLVNLKLPSDISVIGDEAFSGCVNWVAEDGVFTLPSLVTELSPYMLEDCDSITMVVLHSKVHDFVEQIGNVYSPSWSYKVYGVRAFRGMDNLADIVMPSSLGYIVDHERGLLIDVEDGAVIWAFPALTKGIVELPEDVTIISALAFDGNEGVTGILFGNVKYLGAYAFRNCVNLDVSTLDLEGITYEDSYYPTFMGAKGYES